MIGGDFLELEAAKREAEAARSARDIARLQRALARQTATQKRIYVTPR